MAESASAWQQQQREKAVSTQIKRPDIPGDYGGHPVPPIPRTQKEGFIGSMPAQATWFAVMGSATLLLAAISLRQWLK